MSEVLTNPYRFVAASDYPDGIGSVGDGVVTWFTTLSPARDSVSAGSNLPTYSWEWIEGYRPKITTSYTVNMGNIFSFSAWIKFNNLDQWTSLMCGKGLYDGTEEFISYNGSGAQTKPISGEALKDKQMNTFFGTDQGLALDTWYHIVYTVDGDAGEYFTYIDGTQYNVNSGTESAAGTVALLVGSTRMSGTSNYFGGHMQQFLHHNRVLTSSEVGLLYGSGNGIELPDTSTTLQDGLLIYYDFQQDNTGASGTFTITNQAIP